MRRKVAPHKRHVVATGGTFDREILKHVLQLTGKRKPRIMLVPTASGEDPWWREWFLRNLAGLNCDPSILRFFEPVPSDLHKLVLCQDAIFAGGGNSKSMLAVWREWGFDEMLKDAWQRGVVMSGASAGAMCWFTEPVSGSSFVDKTVTLRGLGLVPGSCAPHFDSDPRRAPTFRRLIADGKVAPGYGIDENAALHVTGDGTVRALAAHHGATCHHIAVVDGKLKEEKLQALSLMQK